MGFVKRMLNSLWRVPMNEETRISGDAIDKMDYLLKSLRKQAWDRAEVLAKDRNEPLITILPVDVESAMNQLQMEGWC